MKVPGTLDPRRRRGARPPVADDGYEYEYLEVEDPDAVELDDGWEWTWVEVGDDDVATEPAAERTSAPGPVRRRAAGRRRDGTWRRLLAGLPTTEGAGVDDLGVDTADRLELDDELDQDRGGDGRGRDVVPPRRSSADDRRGSAGDASHESDDDGREGRRPVRRRDRAALDARDRPVVAPADERGDEDGDADGDDGPAVDPRIAARIDDVAQARRARLRRRLVAVAVVFGLLLGVAGLTRTALLDVDEVLVTGTERTQPGSVAAASGVTPGTPLIGLDLEAAAARVRSEPWVREAAVERSWDGTVAIAVVERQPVATVNAGAGGWLLIDGERRVVASSAEPPDLPIVDGVGVAAVGEELGADAQAALDVARALTPALRTRVTVVDGTDPRSIELTLQPSGTVRFGPATSIDERIRALQTVFATVDLVCLETVDLRVAGSATLKRVPSCA